MGRKGWVFGLLVAVLLWLFWSGPVQPERNHLTPAAVVLQSGPGRLVIDLQDGAGSADLAYISKTLGVQVRWVHPQTQDEALAVAMVPDVLAAVAKLRGEALVEVAEPSISQAMFGYPDDPLYPKQWHMDAMGAPVGWKTTARGKGVTVAVLDTGVAGVEDMASERLLKGISFVQGESGTVDEQGHGTHVAGTIAQSTNNGLGTAGVAPDSTILPVKVLSSRGSGTSEGIAAGIDYAVDAGADVINLSLGGSYSRVIHLAIQKARAKNVIVVAAAGNSGRKGVSYPGALPETIGVSALDYNGKLAHYSSWGVGVDLAAPGGDTRQKGGGVLQNTIDKEGNGSAYLEFQGTSMATPHVSGAAAVLLSMHLSPDDVERVLLDSADGNGVSPKLGHGQLDLGRALGLSDTRSNMWQFGISAFLMWLLASLGSASPGRRLTAVAIAGLTAGGLFFMDWLPVSQGWMLQGLSQGMAYWPTQFFGPFWGFNPLWLSALMPLGVTFLLGVQRQMRILAVGIVVGFGTQLFYGAAMGSLTPSILPGTVGTLWLTANGTVCLLLGLALVGMDGVETN